MWRFVVCGVPLKWLLLLLFLSALRGSEPFPRGGHASFVDCVGCLGNFWNSRTLPVPSHLLTQCDSPKCGCPIPWTPCSSPPPLFVGFFFFFKLMPRCFWATPVPVSMLILKCSAKGGGNGRKMAGTGQHELPGKEAKMESEECLGEEPK